MGSGCTHRWSGPFEAPRLRIKNIIHVVGRLTGIMFDNQEQPRPNCLKLRKQDIPFFHPPIGRGESILHSANFMPLLKCYFTMGIFCT